MNSHKMILGFTTLWCPGKLKRGSQVHRHAYSGIRLQALQWIHQRRNVPSARFVHHDSWVWGHLACDGREDGKLKSLQLSFAMGYISWRNLTRLDHCPRACGEPLPFLGWQGRWSKRMIWSRGHRRWRSTQRERILHTNGVAVPWDDGRRGQMAWQSDHRRVAWTICVNLE